MKEMIYLASPYSVGKGGAYGTADTGKASGNMKTRRYKAACRKAAELMKKGYVVFSPIAHSHSVEKEGMGEIETGDFWLEQDLVVLGRCDKLLVYKLEGWDKSRGIAREIRYAEEHDIPIEYVE